MQVNGYEVSRLECSRSWAVMKAGVARGGVLFRTKRAAVRWAEMQDAANDDLGPFTPAPAMAEVA